MNLLLLFINGFDLFVVLYLSDEITVASAELMYCVFEANWIGQPKAVVQNLIVLAEVLKKPHELIILKLYTMNLATFTAVFSSLFSYADLVKRKKN